MSTTLQFTDAQFIEAIRAVAAEAPEYVYPVRRDVAPGCVYYRLDGAKACIIGETLARLGVPQDDLREMFDFAERLLPDYGISDRVARAAQRAQTKQDDGRTWGEAIEAFNAALEP